MRFGLILSIAVACTTKESIPPTPGNEDVNGVLAGSVTIGPLCPIEPCGASIGDTYSSRNLLLQQPGGKLRKVLLQSDGTFEAVVLVGKYTVTLDRCQYLGCQGVFPISVEIRDGETSTLDIDIDTGIRSAVRVSETHQLSEGLRAAEVSVEVGESISQPFFSVQGQLLTVNGQDVQVFEFANAEDADTGAETVSADGSSIGTSMVGWVAPPHFYKAGKLIVIYLGSDSDVTNALQAAMEPSLQEEHFPALLRFHRWTQLLIRLLGSRRTSHSWTSLRWPSNE